jgi:uncharacterized protein (DUF697 family)
MATQTPAVESPNPATSNVPLTKEGQAYNIVKQNVLWAAGGGLIPVPVLDVVAITAVEVKMLRELAALYGVPFQEERIRTICVALLAGLGAPVIGTTVATSFLKSIPFLGFLTGLVVVPGIAAAFTYAVGKVFIQHFASGGTFLDFDPKKVREHFAREFAEGKLATANMKADPTPQSVA